MRSGAARPFGQQAATGRLHPQNSIVKCQTSSTTPCPLSRLVGLSRIQPVGACNAIALSNGIGSKGAMAGKLHVGELAPPFTLQSARGGSFDSRALLGRMWLLSFHRYAT